MRLVSGPLEKVHVRDQAGQPYGSERRCCNNCGVMLWGRSPRYVASWDEFYEIPKMTDSMYTNCNEAQREHQDC